MVSTRSSWRSFRRNLKLVNSLFWVMINTKPSADQIKLVVWSLERTIDLMPPGVENLSLIIDFGSNHSASSGSPTTVYQAKEVIKILQTYYCERLGKAICINVPWVFWGFYKLVKPFLDSRTAEKIEFDPVLTDLVPAEQLPKEPFGGDLDFEYVCILQLVTYFIKTTGTKILYPIGSRVVFFAFGQAN
ncbi:CRAL-TRIO domain-containing protein [Phakopsora pachyrhizi]|nr:CRAL-TRIO domain-containing protein [Phakopsora pachyrhizi]